MFYFHTVQQIIVSLRTPTHVLLTFAARSTTVRHETTSQDDPSTIKATATNTRGRYK